MNEVKVFKFRGMTIEAVVLEGEELFDAKQVGEALGLNDEATSKAVSRMSDKQKMVISNKMLLGFGVNFTKKLNNRGKSFLTKEGVVALISKSRTQTIKTKIEVLDSLGIKDAKLLMIDYPEVKFLEHLETSLDAIGVTDYIEQYTINNKRIDLYIPSLNIAIEYDEDGHGNYSYEAQEGRQAMIEEELGCEFLRYDSRIDNIVNVAQAIAYVSIAKYTKNKK